MSSNWKIWRDNPRFLARQTFHNFIVSSFLRCTGKQVTKNPSNSISTFQFVKRKGYAHDLNTPHQTVEHSVWISQQMADLKKTKNLKAWWWPENQQINHEKGTTSRKKLPTNQVIKIVTTNRSSFLEILWRVYWHEIW
jgi:hypothetical protein